MDAKIKIMVLALMALLIGACATSASKKTQQLAEDWQGKNFNDLIAAKGAPDDKLDDGQGGKIFIYSTYEYKQDSVSGSGGSSSRGGGSGGGTDAATRGKHYHPRLRFGPNPRTPVTRQQSTGG